MKDKEPLEKVFVDSSLVLKYDEKSKKWIVTENNTDYFTTDEFNGS